MDAPVITKIVQRQSGDGHPFSELVIAYNGRTFYSRFWWVIQDTEHTRAYEIAAFKRRQGIE